MMLRLYKSFATRSVKHVRPMSSKVPPKDISKDEDMDLENMDINEDLDDDFPDDLDIDEEMETLEDEEIEFDDEMEKRERAEVDDIDIDMDIGNEHEEQTKAGNEQEEHTNTENKNENNQNENNNPNLENDADDEWHGFDGDMNKVDENNNPLWQKALQSYFDENANGGKKGNESDKKHSSSTPMVRYQTLDENGRAYGTGRRKTSVARVWIWPKDDNQRFPKFVVNRMDFAKQFDDDFLKESILMPFMVTGKLCQYNMLSTVQGGGSSGQAGALRHGIARALQAYEPTDRPALKKAGYLTRDPRMVERKKAGQKKARKKFQWVKR